MKKQRLSFGLVGTGSLLTAFGVLCMTVFALLGLSTALAEQRLADSSLQAVTAYYAADLQAEEILARLRLGESLPEVECHEDLYSYQCPISQTQYLAVEVRLRDGQWQIQRWQAVYKEAPLEENAGALLGSGSQEDR